MWLKLIRIFQKLRKKNSSKAKKSKKKIILLIVAILLLVAIALSVSSIFDEFEDNLQRAAITADTENWEEASDEWYRQHAPDPTASYGDGNQPVYIPNSGGLSGLGYDFVSYIDATSANDPQHLQAQMLQLLDMISVEWNQPCTLLGISLLGMECSFWSGGASGDSNLCNAGEFDMYKYRATKYRSPGVGGGQYWHGLGNTEAEAKSKADDLHKNWIVYEPSQSKKYGYWNAGAFGLCQIESYIWDDSDPKKYHYGARAIADPSREMFTVVEKCKHSVDAIMSLMNKDTYWQDFNSYSAQNGIIYNSFTDFRSDPSNVLQNAFSLSCYFTCYTSALRNGLEFNTHDDNLWKTGKHYGLVFNKLAGLGIDASYRTLENLNEAEQNVLATMYGLWAWNGGAGYCSTNFESSDKYTDHFKEKLQLERLFCYDLSKYLVANGVDALYADGFVAMSNGYGDKLSQANCDVFKKNFDILMSKLYPGDAQQVIVTKMTEYFSPWWSRSTTGGTDGFIYAVNGIIRAQHMLNNSAGIVASDGSTPNIYAAVYVRSFNVYAGGISGIIARAIEAGEEKHDQNVALLQGHTKRMSSTQYMPIAETSKQWFLDTVQKEFDTNTAANQRIIQYSQPYRWSGDESNYYGKGAYYDCSAFVSYMLYMGGLNYFKSHSLLSYQFGFCDKMRGLIDEGKILVIYKTTQTGVHAKGTHTNKELVDMMIPGDIIMWNSGISDRGEALGIGHVGLYYGDGKIIESCPGRYEPAGQSNKYSFTVRKDGGRSSELRGPGIYIRPLWGDNDIVYVIRLTDAAIEPLGGTLEAGYVSAGGGVYNPVVGAAGSSTGTVISSETTVLPTYTGTATVTEVPFNHSWPYAKYSIIHSDKAKLYYPENWNGMIICINAGHGTNQAESNACSDPSHVKIDSSYVMDSGTNIKSQYKEKFLNGELGTYASLPYVKDVRSSGLYTVANIHYITKKNGGGTNSGDLSYTVSSGMSFNDGENERSATLRMAAVVRDKLLWAGYGVLMIRDTNIPVANMFDSSGKPVIGQFESDRTQLDNVARTIMANNIADVHIAIHYNSVGVASTDNQAEKAFYIEAPKNSSWAEVSIDGTMKYFEMDNKFGDRIIQGLSNNGHPIQGSGASDPNDLTQTSYSTIPSIDLELGYRNSARNRDMANKLAQGVLDGLNLWFADYPVSASVINERKSGTNISNAHQSTGTGTGSQNGTGSELPPNRHVGGGGEYWQYDDIN